MDWQDWSHIDILPLVDKHERDDEKGSEWRNEITFAWKHGHVLWIYIGNALISNIILVKTIICWRIIFDHICYIKIMIITTRINTKLLTNRMIYY